MADDVADDVTDVIVNDVADDVAMVDVRAEAVDVSGTWIVFIGVFTSLLLISVFNDEILAVS